MAGAVVAGGGVLVGVLWFEVDCMHGFWGGSLLIHWYAAGKGWLPTMAARIWFKQGNWLLQLERLIPFTRSLGLEGVGLCWKNRSSGSQNC